MITSNDPIFAGIEAHRAAYAVVNGPGESSVEEDCDIMENADTALLGVPVETLAGAHALMLVLREHHVANYSDDCGIDLLLVGLMDKVIARLAQ